MKNNMVFFERVFLNWCKYCKHWTVRSEKYLIAIGRFASHTNPHLFAMAFWEPRSGPQKWYLAKLGFLWGANQPIAIWYFSEGYFSRTKFATNEKHRSKTTLHFLLIMCPSGFQSWGDYPRHKGPVPGGPRKA